MRVNGYARSLSFYPLSLSRKEAISCWACGSTVERERIEDTLERLRELHRERLDERSEVTERIDDLVDYFESYVDCLVVALLPEDAQALSDEVVYVTGL